MLQTLAAKALTFGALLNKKKPHGAEKPSNSLPVEVNRTVLHG